MKFFFIFFLLPLQLFAQDITGVWTGTLYNDTTKQFIKYELAISEYEGKLSGYSHTIFMIDSVENIGIKSIKIKKQDENFLIEDDKLIYNNYTAPPAKGVKTFSRLELLQNDSAMVLSGKWNTNQTKTYKKLTGNIFLQKKKEIDKTLIIPKLENLGLTGSLSFTSPANNLTALNKPVSDLTKKEDHVIKNETDTISTLGNPVKKEKSLEKTFEVNAKKDDNSLKREMPEADRSLTITKDSSKIRTIDITSSTSQIEKPEKADKKNVIALSDKQEVAVKKEVIEKKKLPAKETPAPKAEPPKITSSYATIETPGLQKATFKNTENLIKKEINQSSIVVKTFIPTVAAEIATRKIETIKSVEIKKDSLVLSLFDNGEIDGDTVSVLLNGKVIMPRQGLMSRAINKTIYLTPENGRFNRVDYVCRKPREHSPQYRITGNSRWGRYF